MRFNLTCGVAIAAALTVTACRNDLTLPNYNTPTVAGLSGDPAGLQLAATGILVSDRNQYNNYITDVSILGREGYYYFQTDARYVTDYLVGAGSGANRALSSTGFAATNWFPYFQNMRNAFNLVNARRRVQSVGPAEGRRTRIRQYVPRARHVLHDLRA